MQSYEDRQRDIVEPAKPLRPSGVACTGIDCPGELGYIDPPVYHPELKGLQRVICQVCGWRGWA